MNLLLIELFVRVPQPPLGQLPLVVANRLCQLVQLSHDVGAARIMLVVRTNLGSRDHLKIGCDSCELVISSV